MEQRNLNQKTEIYSEPEQDIQWSSATRKALVGTWSVVRLAAIFISALFIVAAVCLYGYQYADSHFLQPPTAEMGTPQEIIVVKGMSLNKLSLLLEEKDLVRNAKVFKYYVDFSGYGSKIKAGSYVLDSSMSMDAIMEKLAKGDEAMQTTSFLITEGSTVAQVAAQLQKQKIITDTSKFLQLCKTGDAFKADFPFIKDVLNSKNASKRYYALEGYLFPAKYEIYVGATEEQIIRKMLTKYDSVMTDSLKARAKALNMTVDQAVTLASLIEKEAKPNDFTKASAVFHNRLNINKKLESDVTVLYALKKSSLSVSVKETQFDSLYNTYKYKGLPLGPISNPGQKALEAALNPDQQYMKDGYLYFVLINAETGETAYAKTYAEHQKNVKKWEKYKKEHNIP